MNPMALCHRVAVESFREIDLRVEVTGWSAKRLGHVRLKLMSLSYPPLLKQKESNEYGNNYP